MKVICIDDSNKPKNVPESEWIVMGETYTVTQITRMGLQKETYGYLLKEIQLSINSFPYELYNAERFFPIGLIEAFNENKEEKEEINSQEADLELI